MGGGKETLYMDNMVGNIFPGLKMMFDKSVFLVQKKCYGNLEQLYESSSGVK